MLFTPHRYGNGTPAAAVARDAGLSTAEIKRGVERVLMSQGQSRAEARARVARIAAIGAHVVGVTPDLDESGKAEADGVAAATARLIKALRA